MKLYQFKSDKNEVYPYISNWKIKIFKMYIISLLFLLVSCKDDSKPIESPLISVIKYNSARESFSFIKAEEYIDIERVFGEFSDENYSARDIWNDYCEGMKRLTHSRIFTNKMRYHGEDIYENIKNNKAQVYFKDSETGDKGATFFLEFISNKWVIVKIGVKRSSSN